jgi:hypothetical protein
MAQPRSRGPRLTALLGTLLLAPLLVIRATGFISHAAYRRLMVEAVRPAARSRLRRRPPVSPGAMGVKCAAAISRAIAPSGRSLRPMPISSVRPARATSAAPAANRWRSNRTTPNWARWPNASRRVYASRECWPPGNRRERVVHAIAPARMVIDAIARGSHGYALIIARAEARPG